MKKKRATQLKKVRTVRNPPPAYLSGNNDWMIPLFEAQQTEEFKALARKWAAEGKRMAFRLIKGEGEKK